MTQTENNTDFKTALKAAIIESLSGRGLITPVEKTALNQKNLSTK